MRNPMAEPQTAILRARRAAGNASRGIRHRLEVFLRSDAARLLRAGRVSWLVMAAGVAAGVLMILAEFLLIRYVTTITASCSDLATPALRDSCQTSGHESHHWALAILGLFVIVMAFGAAAGKSRPAAYALLASGLVCLLITLARDLPDTSKKGQVGVAFADAQAHTGAGFWLELIGGLLAVGAAALALTTPVVEPAEGEVEEGEAEEAEAEEPEAEEAAEEPEAPEEKPAARRRRRRKGDEGEVSEAALGEPEAEAGKAPDEEPAAKKPDAARARAARRRRSRRPRPTEAEPSPGEQPADEEQPAAEQAAAEAETAEGDAVPSVEHDSPAARRSAERRARRERARAKREKAQRERQRPARERARKKAAETEDSQSRGTTESKGDEAGDSWDVSAETSEDEPEAS